MLRPTPTPFARTLRAIESDGLGRSRLGIAIGAVLLIAWALWLSFARITLYESSKSARLEVERAVHPLEVTIEGRVIASNLALDRVVEEGEVLIQLDDRQLRLRMLEETSRRSALEPQLGALRAELA